MVVEESPDVLIIATGAEPAVPDIAGITGKNVIGSWDVLAGKAEVPGPVAAVAGRV